jgi:hypothetical protein
MKKLTDLERREVEHWRVWLRTGSRLEYAPMALGPLLAIIDRLTSSPLSSKDGQ